jgi:cobalt-zinc-cadmium efflux system outer membrane protein
VRKSACIVGLTAAISLTGCIKYHALPLDPIVSEQQFRARSLTDPGLREFVKRHDWPPARLSLNDLEAVALYYNLDLDVARAQLRTAQAAIITASARPNPSLSLGGGYETDPESNVLFSFLPTFTVVTAGKRGWRILEAEKTAEAASVAVEEAAWNVRRRVRSAWLDYLLALRSLEQLRQESGVRAEMVNILEKRVAAGDAARPEADAARAALISVDVTAKVAEAQVSESRASLAATVGLPVFPSIDERDIPPPPDQLPLADVQKAGLLHRADVRRSLLEYAAADAGLHLEIANQYPDFDFSPGYSFNEGFHQFLLDTSSSIPLFNRNRGPIAEAEARRSEAAARFNALQAHAIGEMEVALANYKGAMAELSDAEQQLIRIEQTRQTAMQRAVQAGEEDRLALEGVRVDGVVAARARLDALRRVQVALGALEDAVQHSLEPGSPLPDPMIKPK